MSWWDYIRRLGTCFCMDPEHYTYCPHLSPKVVAKKYTKLAHKVVPRRFRSRDPSTPSTLPTAYLTVKGKCLDEEGRMVCTREHAHHREIVPSASIPQKRFLRLAARGLRLVKKLSGDRSWTIWEVNALPRLIREKVSRLKEIDAYQYIYIYMPMRSPQK